MAKSKVTVDVEARLTISDETAERCLRILEMWQEDNPDKRILGERFCDRTLFRIVNREFKKKEEEDDRAD